MKNILTFLLIFSLIGCASYPSREMYEQKLSKTEITNYEMSEFRYSELPKGKKLKFELGGDATAHDFGTGKTFYKSFRLPSIEGNPKIELRSSFNTVAQKYGHVSLPTILVLSENFGIIDKKKSQMLQDHDWRNNVQFKDEIVLTPSSRYIVIYVDPDDLGRAVPWKFNLSIVTPSVMLDESSYQKAKVGYGGPMEILLK